MLVNDSPLSLPRAQRHRLRYGQALSMAYTLAKIQARWEAIEIAMRSLTFPPGCFTNRELAELWTGRVCADPVAR